MYLHVQSITIRSCGCDAALGSTHTVKGFTHGQRGVDVMRADVENGLYHFLMLSIGSHVKQDVNVKIC